MRMSRGMVPAIAAAVVVLVVVAWWVIARGDDETDTASPPQPPPAAETAPVPIDGYFPRSETVLALNYSIGVPACYGTLTEPVLTETADAVTVTLSRTVPDLPDGTACIEIALMQSAVITLDEPLGDRIVQDGSRDNAVVERAASAYDDGTEVDPTG